MHLRAKGFFLWQQLNHKALCRGKLKTDPSFLRKDGLLLSLPALVFVLNWQKRSARCISLPIRRCFLIPSRFFFLPVSRKTGQVPMRMHKEPQAKEKTLPSLPMANCMRCNGVGRGSWGPNPQPLTAAGNSTLPLPAALPLPDGRERQSPQSDGGLWDAESSIR